MRRATAIVTVIVAGVGGASATGSSAQPTGGCSLSPATLVETPDDPATTASFSQDDSDPERGRFELTARWSTTLDCPDSPQHGRLIEVWQIARGINDHHINNDVGYDYRLRGSTTIEVHVGSAVRTFEGRLGGVASCSDTDCVLELESAARSQAGGKLELTERGVVDLASGALEALEISGEARRL